MIKKTIELIIWILAGTGVILLLSFSKNHHQNTTCQSLNIHIYYEGTDTLLRPEQLRKLLQSQCGDFKNKPVHTLDFKKINDVLGGMGQVVSTGAYTDMEGNLNVYARQREPLMRIFTRSNHDYYIDQDGYLFRSPGGNAGHVIIVNGNIPEVGHPGQTIIKIDTLKNGDLIRNLFQLVELLQNSELLEPLIEQVYITGNEEVEMIPKVGRQLITLGGFQDMEEKILKLESFYKQGMMEGGWNKYKSINLKFKDQIVCSKK